MKWVYLRGVFHNTSNINKIKFTDDNGMDIWFMHDGDPTHYFNLTDTDRRIINELIQE